jgi:hypothetical protein
MYEMTAERHLELIADQLKNCPINRADLQEIINELEGLLDDVPQCDTILCTGDCEEDLGCTCSCHESDDDESDDDEELEEG